MTKIQNLLSQAILNEPVPPLCVILRSQGDEDSPSVRVKSSERSERKIAGTQAWEYFHAPSARFFARLRMTQRTSFEFRSFEFRICLGFRI